MLTFLFRKFCFREKRVILAVNESVDIKDIYCLTDSSYYPAKVEIDQIYDNTFALSPGGDGYYWCTYVNPKTLHEIISRKVLFVQEQANLNNLYAALIKIKEKYTPDKVSEIKLQLDDKLKKIINFQIQYAETYDNSNNAYEEFNIQFYDTISELDLRDDNEHFKSAIKRLYLDQQTLLLHIQWDADMELEVSGTWGDVEVLHVKPAFYCKETDDIPTLTAGEFLQSVSKRFFNFLNVKRLQT